MPIPRWEEIVNAIRTDIGEGKLVSGEALPSETRLAAQWRVSRVTAHRAMHELQLQGFVVRKRRTGTVVAERRPRTGRIAVLMNTGDYLEQQYLAGIRSALPDEVDLLFCDVRCDPQREITYLRRMAAETDGILCIPTCDSRNTPLFHQLLRTGVPLVCVDCIPEGIEVDAVISDNYGVTRDALRYLVQRGHRSIAYLTGDRSRLSSLRERQDAYQEVMRENGVTAIRSRVREFPFELHSNLRHQAQIIQDTLVALRHLPDRPTAVFCAYDYILAPVLQACETLGLTVPVDLEILSFHDCPPLIPYVPGNIHRIVQRAREIGNVAAECLCRRLRGEGGAPEIVRIAPVFYPATEAQPGPGG